MEVLKNGDLIKISKGSHAQVMDKLGEGGQGVVYRVWYENKEYALKWYFVNKLKNPHEFYQNLMDNAKRGRPTPAFLWPLYVTEIQRGSFGYLMELRPEKYLDFGKFLTANAFFKSDIAVINAGLHLANGFMKLHREGYSYQDLNDGNFFINPEDGDVLICDNDNVSTKNLGIAGKCRYMAPEVVKGKEKPNSYTDRFSLAIVLFMHFFRSHPFEGARTVESPCITDAMEKKYFGTNPIFCFDPNNSSNRPVKGVHNDIIRLWPMYPKYIQQAFTDVFTRGVNDVSERLTARQWKKLLLRLRNETVNCPYCSCENTMDVLCLKGDAAIKCFECGSVLKKPMSLSVKGHRVALYPKTKLYACHMEGNDDDFTTVAAEVVKNKYNPDIWGIRNLTDEMWILTTPTGRQKVYNKYDVVPIIENVKIDFDAVEGKIIF